MENKGDDMAVVTEKGCIVHLIVQWDRCEDGHSVFKCLLCHEDVAREAEDSAG